MASRISLLFSRGALSPSYHTVNYIRVFSRRSHASSSSSQRLQLLNRIYSRFHHLQKDSAEYKTLAESGRCWSEYFDPGNINRYRYKILEEACMSVVLSDHYICIYSSLTFNRNTQIYFVKSILIVGQ